MRNRIIEKNNTPDKLICKGKRSTNLFTIVWWMVLIPFQQVADRSGELILMPEFCRKCKGNVKKQAYEGEKRKTGFWGV